MTVYSDELYHHGIKGQRWGVRRQRPGSSFGSRVRTGIRKARITMQRRRSAAAARKTKARRAAILKDPVKLNKHKDEFSNEEIKKALERFDLEKKLSEASRSQILKGAEWLGVAAKYATNSYVTANQINNLVGLTTGNPIWEKPKKDKK